MFNLCKLKNDDKELKTTGNAVSIDTIQLEMPKNMLKMFFKRIKNEAKKLEALFLQTKPVTIEDFQELVSDYHRIIDKEHLGITCSFERTQKIYQEHANK